MLFTILATSLAAATTLVPVWANGPKCGSTGEVGVQAWRVEGSCNGSDPVCFFEVEVPIDSCKRHDMAVAYLSGWETYNLPVEHLTQIHRFGIALEKQYVDYTAPDPVLRLMLVYQSEISAGFGHDKADFAVWFEVLSYESSSSVQTAWFDQTSTDPGGTTSSLYVDPSFGDLAFIGLSRFEISTDRTGTGDGSNPSDWGLRRVSKPYSGTTGIYSEQDCAAEGDHGFPSKSTSCFTTNVAVSAPGLLERATTQPSSVLHPTTLGPASASVPFAGVGVGKPTCALSTFVFRADPLTPGFKYRSLGFYVPDCDRHLLDGGQSGVVIADGGTCEDPSTPGVPDQSGGVSTQLSKCTPIDYTGEFGMDAAALR